MPEEPAPDANLEDEVDRLLAELKSAYFELFRAIVAEAVAEATRTTDPESR